MAMRFAYLLLIASLPLAFAASAQQNDLRLMVPAYANPCCAGGPAMWSNLITLGTSRPNDVLAIFNPQSGPGPGPVDPNYVNASGQGPLINLINTNALVIGYVATDRTQRPLATVQAEIMRYYQSSYWRGFNIRLDGIFFDEMSTDLAATAYHQALRDTVRALDPNALLVGNPGTSGTQNPSGQATFSVADYVAVFDTIVVFEDTRSAFATSYVAPTWIGDAPRSKVAMIVHTTPTERLLRASLSQALARGAGWIYVTDDVLTPNVFDTLPSYWAAQTTLHRQLMFVDGFELD